MAYTLKKKRDDSAPPGYMTLAQFAHVTRAKAHTISAQVNRAIHRDIGRDTKLGSKRTADNPAVFYTLDSNRRQKIGDAQNHWLFPTGLIRIGGRWCFPAESVGHFLEIRAQRAMTAAKMARQDLEFFKSQYMPGLEAHWREKDQ